MQTCNELLLDSRGVSAEEEHKFFIELWYQFKMVLSLALEEPEAFACALEANKNNLARTSKGGEEFIAQLDEWIASLKAGEKFEWEPLIRTHFKVKITLEEIARMISTSPYLPQNKWKNQLSQEIKKLEDKRNQFLTKNLRLVIKFISPYISIPSHLRQADIIQHGNIGLLKAIERFNPWAEVRFSTYASWWIHHKIRRALENEGRNIRLPNREIKEAYKKDKAIQNSNVEAPNDEEQTLNKVILTRLYKNQVIQLDAPHRTTGEEGGTILQTFVDSDNPDGYEFAAWNELKRNITKAINYLDERGKYILVKRFGLEDGAAEPLSKIGSDLNLSRERIRQLEAKALKKIGRILNDYND